MIWFFALLCIGAVIVGFAEVSNKTNQETTFDISEKKSSNNNYLIALSLPKIPREVAELIWFKDWKLKNYTPDESNMHEYELFEGFSVRMGIIVEDPSALSVKLPIEERIDYNPLGYFPSYEKMTPSQRYTYLIWLSDITQPIDIGYVFVFYYGLERHIYTGEYEKAFDMILKLRKYHTNSSFNGYSTDVLLTCCLIYNRRDLFEKLQHSKICEISNDFYLYARYCFDTPLSAEELFYLYDKIQFPNKRYIKQYPAKFKSALEEVLIEETGKNYFDLKEIDLKDCQQRDFFPCANISLRQRYLDKSFPILINKITSEKIIDYFNKAHEKVKQNLKIERKNH